MNANRFKLPAVVLSIAMSTAAVSQTPPFRQLGALGRPQLLL